MPTDGTPPSTELALLRSELLLPLTELRGDVRLILQRMDQQDARAQEHGHQLAQLDGRVDAVERTTVTREELATALAQVHTEMAKQQAASEEKARRNLTVWGLLLTALGVGVAVIAIIVN